MHEVQSPSANAMPQRGIQNMPAISFYAAPAYLDSIDPLGVGVGSK
jgi:hypothetical protein